MAAPSDIAMDVKAPLEAGSKAPATAFEIHSAPLPSRRPAWLRKLEYWENRLGIEGRGISRVPPNERHSLSFVRVLQMFVLWFSINLTANNLAIGFLGPVVFGLGFRDSVLCLLFGNVAGSFAPGYVASFGPLSGSRTLVVGRYTMGYWATKLCAILQLCGTLGFGVIDVLVCGQILSAVSEDGKMSVIVGIVIASVVTAIVCIIGMRVFQKYERYAFIPQAIVFFIMVGVASKHFDTASESTGSPAQVRGGLISFFFLCFNVMVIWSICAGDYYPYYPENTPRFITGAMTHLGICLAMTFVQILGVGLATGAAKKDTWGSAFEKGQGQLMVEAFAPLGGFGKFCGVVLALGPIANNIPGIYSSALAWQILGHYAESLPRVFWTMVGIVLTTLAGIVGRNHLYTIFENILSLLGYWCSIFISIHILEEVLFRRLGLGPKMTSEMASRFAKTNGEIGNRNSSRAGPTPVGESIGKGYDWDAWNDRWRLPVGLAATTSFVLGWVGAILCMSQVWWTGPVGRAVKGDIGVPVAAGVAALLYPPLRWLELKFMGR